MNFPCDLSQLFSYTWSLFNHHLSSYTVRVNELLCAWYMEEIPLQSPEEKRKGSLPNSFLGFPGGPSAKELACQCTRLRDTGLLPVTGRSPGGGHGNPLQNSCLENPMDRGAWQATAHRVTVAHDWSDLAHTQHALQYLYQSCAWDGSWDHLFWDKLYQNQRNKNSKLIT